MSHRHQRGSRRDVPVEVGTPILAIDHDRQVGRALAFMLAARGYDEFRAVRSANRAISVFELFRPGIVFLDLELPDVDSLQLAQKLRRGAKQRTFRLIALTREVEHGRREEARAAGFERFFVKPVAQEELDKILGIRASAPV